MLTKQSGRSLLIEYNRYITHSLVRKIIHGLVGIYGNKQIRNYVPSKHVFECGINSDYQCTPLSGTKIFDILIKRRSRRNDDGCSIGNVRFFKVSDKICLADRFNVFKYMYRSFVSEAGHGVQIDQESFTVIIDLLQERSILSRKCSVVAGMSTHIHARKAVVINKSDKCFIKAGRIFSQV